MEQEKPIKRILVLGGSSFVGLTLMMQLSKKVEKDNSDPHGKFETHIYYINRGKNYWNNKVKSIPNLHYINGNRSDKEEFSKLLSYTSNKIGVSSQNKWQSVIDFSAFKWQNIRSVYNALKGLIDQYIFVSTDSVYDVCVPKVRGAKYTKKNFTGKIISAEKAEFFGQKIDESCDVRYTDPKDIKRAKDDDKYGHQKMQCEEYLQNETDKAEFPFIILRFSDVIGPYDDTGRFWSYVKWLTELNKSYPIPNDSETLRNLISLVFSEDIVRLMIHLIQNAVKIRENYDQLMPNNSPLYKALNLACEEAITVEELVEEIHQNIPAEKRACSKVNSEKVSSAPAFFPSVECGPISVSQAKKLANWKPTNIKEAIKTSTEFFLNAQSTGEYRSEEKQAEQKLNKKLKK